MENVHNSEARTWISKKINLRQFRNDWHNSLIHSEENIDFREKIISSLGLSEEEFSTLEEECSETALNCLDEDLIDPDITNDIPDEVDLRTLRSQKRHLERKKIDPSYRSRIYNSTKLSNYPPHEIPAVEVSQSGRPNSAIELPEIILTVQILRPEKRTTGFQRLSAARAPRFHVDQEFYVLGCQYLTELRDKIDCVSDMAIPGDYSEDPTVPPEATCKDLYKSGFFYIDGTFFNDMRDHDCRDYSEVIIKWGADKNRFVGPFFKALMEETKFIDLQIQLGYPYVYVHQGCCEHLLVFNDLCMVSTQSKNRNDYPMYASHRPKKRVFCRVCHYHTAVWVVFDNKRLPENPFFFCSSCFYGFNYTVDGEKEGEFRAYHFPDRTALT